MAGKGKRVEAIGYLRTSSATNIGEGKDSEAPSIDLAVPKAGELAVSFLCVWHLFLSPPFGSAGGPRVLLVGDRLGKVYAHSCKHTPLYVYSNDLVRRNLRMIADDHRAKDSCSRLYVVVIHVHPRFFS